MLSFGFKLLNDWFVAIISIIANGSNTKIISKINIFAVFLIGIPVSSLTYLIAPSSFPNWDLDSIFNTWISRLVKLSFNASIFVDILVLFFTANVNCDSNALRFPVFALLITWPVFLSMVWVVVFVESAFLSCEISLSNVFFSKVYSFLISLNRSLFNWTFATSFPPISSLDIFSWNPVVNSP